MIIQIVGTNGSGKSTVVQEVLRRADRAEPVVTEERSSPAGYLLRLPGVAGDVFVVGSYDRPTGGADTFNSLARVHDLVAGHAAAGRHVIFEGAGHTMNQTRGPALLRRLGVPFFAILLNTPLGICLDSIGQRRRERGAGELADDYIIRGNYVRANNYAARLRDAGARVIRASRDEAPGRVMELLRGG